MNEPNRKRQLWLTIGGVVVALLAAAVFSLGSLRIPLQPDGGTDFIILFALSTFIAVALLVFSLILVRSLLRLWAERRSGQMGSRFKVKMVMGAMGVSLLPVVFLFFFSYALVNRTLNMWFPRPLEISNQEKQQLTFDFLKQARDRINLIGAGASAACTFTDAHGNKRFDPQRGLDTALAEGIDVAWIMDAAGNVTATAPPGPSLLELKANKSSAEPALPLPAPRFAETLSTKDEIWQRGDTLSLPGNFRLATPEKRCSWDGNCRRASFRRLPTAKRKRQPIRSKSKTCEPISAKFCWR